jgi:hypothetical protein
VEDKENGSGAEAEFLDVPVALIETGAQVRKGIDPEGESIRALADSIRAKGSRPRTYRHFLGISASIKAADATLGDPRKPVTREALPA